MPFPYHYLFSFGGTLLGTSEIWSNNIRFIGALNGEDEYDEPEILGRLMGVMSTRFTLAAVGSSLGYSSAVRLTWGKFNKIGPDGKYASTSEANTQFLATPGIAGGGAAASNVPQLALAVSWGTARARGTASRGRIFIPMPNIAPAPDGRIAAATRQGLANAWAAAIDELNDVAQGVGQERPIAAVVSGTSGQAAPITTVRVGDVMDTMRSRRNALVESYSTASVPDSE